jgi:hypothetical protein
MCDALELHRSSTSDYWNLIRKLQGKRFHSGIPSMKCDNYFAFTDFEKATALRDKFMNRFHHAFPETILPACHPKTANVLEAVTIKRDMVRNILRNLDASNKMLKMVANTLADPLCKLLQKLLNSGTFPVCWKKGTIVIGQIYLTMDQLYY